MQDEVNEKTIALYIKTGKLTAQTLQKAMKAILSKGKKQLTKQPQGKQSLKQLRSSRKRTQAFFRPSCPGFRYSQGLCLECF